MAELTFIQPDGTRQTVEAEIGQPVMRAALNAGVPGVFADCGGNCSCATCHCLVDSGWFDKLPPAGLLEKGILEGLEESGETGRLTCQITMTPDLDGMVLHLPGALVV